MNSPYLSVVVTARNDDHGGNLLGRMQAFVNGLLNQCARHELPAELIIVDWNPPPGRPPLASALHWEFANPFCDVRVIEVPNELHRRFDHWRALPLYQMIAKNVGIRRAHGEFILATNIDILFSDELMSFIAARRLERGRMYRIDRWDVESDVPIDAPVERQLEYCQTHTIRVSAREGTYRVSSDGVRILESNDIARPDSGVTVGGNWFPREMSADEPFRWADNAAELLIDPSRGESVLVLDVEPGPGVRMEAFSLELRGPTGEQLGSVIVKRRTIVTFPVRITGPDPIRLTLHTPQGGAKIASDPRTLNFRVFRAALESPSATAKIIRADSARAHAAQGLTARLGRGLRFLRDLCTSTVQLRIPMSQRRLDRLSLRQDGGGVSFFVGPLTGGSASQEGLLGPNLTVVWGDGWYATNFRGESFRWMRQRGSLCILLPPVPVSQISLLVEPGPAVGFAPVEVEIQDQWGAVLARAAVDGRTLVRVPIASAKSAVTLSLIVHGGGPPKEIPGDSRVMALQVRRIEYPPESPVEAASIEPAETRPRSGIWCARGWTPPDRGGDGMSATSSADLVLRSPSDGQSRLILGVEAAAPVHLIIKDANGRELYHGQVASALDIAIPGDHAPSTLIALHLEIENGPLVLKNVAWQTANDPPARTPIHSDRGQDLAVHLHTNACGDFTLLAREHWMDLRGYPELDVFSMNVDSLFCWTAHHGGAREHVLESPMRIYHIEHATGSGWTPEGQDKLYERIAAKGIPWLSYDDVVQWARAMNLYGAPMIFNHDNWGLAADDLCEVRPADLAPDRQKLPHRAG